jgi:uncharacterized protein
MLLSLADLPLRSGERHERVYPMEFAPVLLGGVEHRVLVPGGVKLKVDRITGGYMVSVSMDAKVYGVCVRCLSEAVLEVHAEQQEFAPTAKDTWEDAEISEFVKDLVVDVDGLAREALILAVPAQVLCVESCKGLCPLCGEDLNKGSCACSENTIDERWSRLKDLKLSDGAEAPEKGPAS